MTDFDLQTTCCFTGHRVLKKDFDDESLSIIIDKLIKNGYKTFLVGMAIGFDLKVFEILQTKKKYNIDVIACVPCKDQDKFYNAKQKEQYLDAIKNADKVIYLSEEYFDGCMQQRNRYMVDNSSILVAYMYAKIGGTIYTVNYAKRQEKNIIYV
ncbi:MAG: DUF1273 domain-containing protein [Clostridiales bacterium]|nr:DUF1273 domain-containing protein [Clostridiales bacterium]